MINGYISAAPELIPRYKAVSPAELLAPVAHLFPPGNARILDIGAGTGGAAAWFAGRGHMVLAVEPVAAFRAVGASPAVEWLDDRLPDLPFTKARGEVFDLILLSAVWHHLTADQRAPTMASLRALLAPAGLLIISLRHGPGNPGRPCYAAPPAEVIALAKSQELHLALCQSAPAQQSENRKTGVSWTWLALCP